VTWVRAALVACLASSCKNPGSAGKARDDAAPLEAAAAEAGAGNRGTYASPAHRCGQCHGELEAEWRASAHARSWSAPAYLAMRAAAASAQRATPASCDACHAPLDKLLATSDPAFQDGVNCDVCHTITEVTPRRAGAGFSLHVDDNTKYGPICDTKNNYFHKVGCSPFHSRSEMCAACHTMYLPSAEGDVPVFTEYDEWNASRYEATGISCQDCHMPSESSSVAVGEKRRGGVAHHDFGANDPRFRGSGLGVRASATQKGDKLALSVSVRNENVGHEAPTGLPERRLVLRVTMVGATGEAVDRAERAYGRILVDALGAPAPFTTAVRVAADTRIGVDETKQESFELTAPSAGEVRVELVWQSIAADLAGKLHAPVDESVLARGALHIDARTPRGSPLPIPITVGP
jgi:cytochrome c554/c'-like protein